MVGSAAVKQGRSQTVNTPIPFWPYTRSMFYVESFLTFVYIVNSNTFRI